MARKTRPTIHKPLFDAESVLLFAAGESTPSGTELPAGAANPGRESLSLQLKSEIVDLIKAEAARKGKTVDQIVAKLVAKHLGKH